MSDCSKSCMNRLNASISSWVNLPIFCLNQELKKRYALLIILRERKEFDIYHCHINGLFWRVSSNNFWEGTIPARITCSRLWIAAIASMLIKSFSAKIFPKTWSTSVIFAHFGTSKVLISIVLCFSSHSRGLFTSASLTSLVILFWISQVGMSQRALRSLVFIFSGSSTISDTVQALFHQRKFCGANSITQFINIWLLLSIYSQYLAFCKLFFIVILCKKYSSFFFDFSRNWSSNDINRMSYEWRALSGKRHKLPTSLDFWEKYLMKKTSVPQSITITVNIDFLSLSSVRKLVAKIHSSGCECLSKLFLLSFVHILATWSSNMGSIILARWSISSLSQSLTLQYSPRLPQIISNNLALLKLTEMRNSSSQKMQKNSRLFMILYENLSREKKYFIMEKK